MVTTLILHIYKDGIFKIFNELSKNNTKTSNSEADNIKNIAIFGELFGGIYPHQDVEDLGYDLLCMCLLVACEHKRLERCLCVCVCV